MKSSINYTLFHPEHRRNPIQWDWEHFGEFGHQGILHGRDNLNQYG